MDLRRECIWWGVRNRRDSCFGVSRQHVAFLDKARKFEGLESLEGDFYTRFKPKN